MGVATGSLLKVSSDQGELILAARVDPSVRPGTVWIPESLPNAPVGALRNGAAVTQVALKPGPKAPRQSA
jgi:anaerobic selenocysteine-containing dehydrogenase